VIVTNVIRGLKLSVAGRERTRVLGVNLLNIIIRHIEQGVLEHGLLEHSLLEQNRVCSSMPPITRHTGHTQVVVRLNVSDNTTAAARGVLTSTFSTSLHCYQTTLLPITNVDINYGDTE